MFLCLFYDTIRKIDFLVFCDWVHHIGFFYVDDNLDLQLRCTIKKMQWKIIQILDLFDFHISTWLIIGGYFIVRYVIQTKEFHAFVISYSENNNNNNNKNSKSFEYWFLF